MAEIDNWALGHGGRRSNAGRKKGAICIICLESMFRGPLVNKQF